MGLFDKKNCDICGNKIGLLGNRKLSDGNMCKDCAAKLSRWFSERRQSTIAQIEEQLKVREANKNAVAAFNASRVLGDDYKVYIDEGARKFMVARTSNLINENPDVIDISAITNVNVDVKDSRSEIKAKDANGNMVSYNPPRYKYTYSFYVEILVNHPFIDEIRFEPETTDVTIEMGGGMVQNGAFGRSVMGNVLTGVVNAVTNTDPSMNPQYQMALQRCNDIKDALLMLRNPGYVPTSAAYPQQNMGYQQVPNGYAQPQYPQQNMGYQQVPNGYAQPQYPQQNMGYQQAPNGYAQPQYPQQNMGYQQAPNGYAQPQYPQQNMGYQQAPNGYAQPQQNAGFPQNPQYGVPENGAWVCPSCGATNTSNFCINCGTAKNF